MPFTCKFCEQKFCSTHRLPENHDCDGLRDYKDTSRQEGKIGYDAMKEEREAREQVSAPTQRSPTPSMVDRAVNAVNQSATHALLAAIVGVFVLQLVLGAPFMELFALNADTVIAKPWTLVTSIFLHGGFMHLVFNGIVLFSFGRVVERILGTEQYLKILFSAAIASSIGFVVSVHFFEYTTQFVTHTPSIIPTAVGISGGLYGIVAFLAMIRPNVQVLAFFVIPLKIRQAVAIFALVDLVNFVAHAAGFTFLRFASAGHLAGLAVGLYFGYRLKDRYRQPRSMDLFRAVSRGGIYR